MPSNQNESLGSEEHEFDKELDSHEEVHDALHKKIKHNNRWVKISSVLATVAVIIAIIFAGCTQQVKDLVVNCQASISNLSTHIPTNGINGADGATGFSGYQEWLNAGNEGSVQEFLDSLKGNKGDTGDSGTNGIDGKDGADGVCTVGDTGSQGEVGPQGAQGEAGATGATGAQGIQGDAGTAFTLVGSYANLSEFNSGAGASQGKAGEGYLLENDGSIMVWTTNDGWIDAGDIRGAQGPTGAQGETGLQGPRGEQGLMGLTGPAGKDGSITNSYYGSWYSAVTQTSLSGVRSRMYWEEIQVEHGVFSSLGPDGKYSNVVFEHDGVYNLQFSAQLHNTGGSGNGQNFIIWLGQNGINVPMSATDVTVNTNGPWMVASWNFFIIAKAGDTAQLFWQNDKDSLVIQATASNGVPGIPSVILTVNQVG